MLNTYLSEALGSFVFFLIVLATGDPIMMAVALLIGILVASLGSQGHLNPAITAMRLMTGEMAQEEGLKYIGAQLLGAFVAVQWYNQLKKD